MPPKGNWWHLQFVESLKELTRWYDRFCITRDIEDFDLANMLHEELNDTHKLSMDLMDFVELGRALLGKQTLPHN